MLVYRSLLVSRRFKLFVLQLVWPLTVYIAYLQVENITTNKSLVMMIYIVIFLVDVNDWKMLLRTKIMSTMFRIRLLYDMCDIYGKA